MRLSASLALKSISELPDSRESGDSSWRHRSVGTSENDITRNGFIAMWRELARKEDGKENNVAPIELVIADNASQDELKLMFSPDYRSSANGVVGILYDEEQEGDFLCIHITFDPESGGVTLEALSASDQVA